MQDCCASLVVHLPKCIKNMPTSCAFNFTERAYKMFTYPKLSIHLREQHLMEASRGGTGGYMLAIPAFDLEMIAKLEANHTKMFKITSKATEGNKIVYKRVKGF